MRNVIQIAGIHDLAEAELLIGVGVGYLGFPLRLPHGGEDLTETTARDVVKAIGPRAHAVVITYLDEAAAIAELTESIGARWVQLHGPIAIPELTRLRADMPGLHVIKSLVVRDDDAAPLIEEVNRVGSLVDAFITDTYDHETGRSGATGKVHPWSVSRTLVMSSPKPVILAGGLTPANVAAAILGARPAGVDSHTGVEGSDGRKDPELVKAFVENAQRAFGALR